MKTLSMSDEHRTVAHRLICDYHNNEIFFLFAFIEFAISENIFNIYSTEKVNKIILKGHVHLILHSN